MSVRIRLRRVGRKKQPYYRVVVTESRNPRGGEYLETLGFYNPRTKPAELRLSLDRVDAWVADGAGLSDTVASLVRKARKGGDRTVAVGPYREVPAAEAAEAAEPAVESAEPAEPAAESALPPEAAAPAAE